VGGCSFERNQSLMGSVQCPELFSVFFCVTLLGVYCITIYLFVM